MTQQTYVVKPGDSLSKIAKELLGDANRWKEIFEANQDTLKDPNLIHPGQELRLPAQEQTLGSVIHAAASATSLSAEEVRAERRESDAAADAFAALTGKKDEGPRRSGIKDER